MMRNGARRCEVRHGANGARMVQLYPEPPKVVNLQFDSPFSLSNGAESCVIVMALGRRPEWTNEGTWISTSVCKIASSMWQMSECARSKLMSVYKNEVVEGRIASAIQNETHERVKGSLWSTAERHHFATRPFWHSFGTQNATSHQTTANKPKIRFTMIC